MNRRASFRRAALATAAASLAIGCTQPVSMLVMVRDRDSLQPLPDARVEVENTSLLNPFKPKGAEGETDERGEVSLSVAPYNRLLVRVTPRGGVASVVNADHPAQAGDTGWIGAKTDESGGRSRIEVRLAP